MRAVPAHDPHETLPAPASVGAVEPALSPAVAATRTVVPAHQAEELRDLRHAIRRLLLLGTCVWPFFFIVDYLGALAEGGATHVLWLAGWRLLGALLGG